jgi:hypothetical protein
VALEQFLDNEMSFDLQLAVEAKALTDINATSGIQTQAYATSVLTTLRNGIARWAHWRHRRTSGFSPMALR